jgi:preprotein translocase subunit SecA
MEGRRFSDGLHQAIECKEGVRIEQENQTLASITFQNYFRRYKKISGMTGTALTEEKEFIKIYNLGVVEIPTNKVLIRKDQNDAIYKTKQGKHNAILKEVKRLYHKKQPVLIGTDSVSSSEELSNIFRKNHLSHEILNAKYHEKEAEIIAKAGAKKSITISTNMAGRGTDIKLGEGVKELGGLYVLGTSRHDSRRIDNQLRGRSGRQGDPGESRFYLSLEDDLLRTFGGARISGLMDRLKIDENEVIEHGLISRAIVNAQKKVEGQNFNIRKHLLEYDDVMNRQREVIYKSRKEIINEKENLLLQMIENYLETCADEYCKQKNSALWDLESLSEQLKIHLGQELDLQELEEQTTQEQMIDFLLQKSEQFYQQKKEHFQKLTPLIEKQVLLINTDNLWKEHLLNMDHLKEGIGLRGFGQKNPLDEYKREAFKIFTTMQNNLHKKCVFDFFHLQIKSEEQLLQTPAEETPMQLHHGSAPAQKPAKVKPITKGHKTGRNDICPCGSGKKYKHCCLVK